GTQLLNRFQAGFHAEGRYHLEQFLTEPTIDGRTAKADAVLAAVIIVALAQIPRMSSGSAPVAYVKLTAAVATAKQSGKQALARTDGRHGFIGLPVDGVAASHPLVFLVSGPVNITHMMAGDEYPTFLGPTHRRLA